MNPLKFVRNSDEMLLTRRKGKPAFLELRISGPARSDSSVRRHTETVSEPNLCCAVRYRISLNRSPTWRPTPHHDNLAGWVVRQSVFLAFQCPLSKRLCLLAVSALLHSDPEFRSESVRYHFLAAPVSRYGIGTLGTGGASIYLQGIFLTFQSRF